ncbi:ATP-dependent DNA helicase RecG [Temperatibacter marinus]|uniref:ATP-dependent DNA helicase RecG n=1 Tax=Temperatibacter marinus TaxID=1456591 RepID=A0AA52H9G4_9PROT|nr:ATP-dependent DNA helicase RecG [Temperatibacter marinus]WND02482.1 ATP-dependent DNA helicase RecG [Temperatibacter marinus]
MRPASLNGYFKDIETLAGIGPRNKAHFLRLFGRQDSARLVDVVFHMPVSVIDRRYRPHVVDAQDGQVATLEVEVLKHIPSHNRKSPYKVLCEDSTGNLTCAFFNPHRSWIEKQLPIGEMRLISGKVEHFRGEIQITHPDYMLPIDQADEMPALETIYPLTSGLGIRALRKALFSALKNVPEVNEWHDPGIMKRETWGTFKESLLQVHSPSQGSDIATNSLYRQRLAYDELLAGQLALALVRDRARKSSGRPIVGTGAITKEILHHLPFNLTGDQQKSFDDIIADMGKKEAMLRLVQGDVGSGKTIVALLAMATAVEAGMQGAILAPTEILARQHMEFMTDLADKVGLKIDLLTGRNKGKKRADLLSRLENGEIDILIGTHAIIQEDVTFANLGLAVIDEQHRFGVQQRMALAHKTVEGADLLVMTATPIPRTLTMTAYGDMDVSLIQEKPPGRKPIQTKVVSHDRLGELVSGLRRALEQGQQIYWVCPLVQESEVLDLAAAEDRYEGLKKVFGAKVGLVHGKMKAAEKDSVMLQFSEGDIRLLVSTTVIEVGVNVPNATIMVIEHAERFGLAQLHQLRGRVGRGEKQSTCMLLRARDIGAVAKSRLQVMRDTEDGFVIAEEDLKLRGAGEILGTRQSGMPEYHFVDLEEHKHLIELARDDARMIMNKDAGLETPRGKALRELLYLFEKDEGVRLLRGG